MKDMFTFSNVANFLLSEANLGKISWHDSGRDSKVRPSPDAAFVQSLSGEHPKKSTITVAL